jgi:hypothetical protein
MIRSLRPSFTLSANGIAASPLTLGVRANSTTLRTSCSSSGLAVAAGARDGRTVTTALGEGCVATAAAGEVVGGVGVAPEQAKISAAVIGISQRMCRARSAPDASDAGDESRRK